MMISNNTERGGNQMIKKNKKGKLGVNTLNSAILVIVVLVVLFAAYAAIIPEAQTAGDSLNDSNRCESVSCFYNATRTTTACTANNATAGDTVICGTQANSIPLGGLFSGTGVVFVIVMAALLIIVVKGFMKAK